MKRILIAIITMFIGLPQTQWISTIAIDQLMQVENSETTEPVLTVDPVTGLPINQTVNETEVYDAELDSNSELFNSERYYSISNFSNQELAGYGVIGVPSSHFNIIDGESTTLLKRLDYKDGKSRLKVSYTTKIPNDIDLSGYITNHTLGMGTVTNDSKEISINNIKWTRIKAKTTDKGNSQYVWFTERDDDSEYKSVFWVSASVYQSSDTEEFHSAVESMLKRYEYSVSSTGRVFGADEIKNVADDVAQFIANSKTHTVFGDRGGILEGLVSSDWHDLEFMIDNVKFALPSKWSYFSDAGYTILDTKRSVDEIVVAAGAKTPITLMNKNGTVVKAYFHNSDLVDEKKLTECSIVKVIIDPQKFISQADAADVIREAKKKAQEELDKAKEELDKAEQEAKEEADSQRENENNFVEEETSTETEGKSAESAESIEETVPEDEYAGRKYIVTGTNVNVREDADSASKVLTRLNSGDEFIATGHKKDIKGAVWLAFQFQDKTGYIKGVFTEEVADASEELSNEEEAERVESETEAVEDNRTAAEKADDAKANVDELQDKNDELLSNSVNDSLHQVILPGGVTWDAYRDDIVSLYGSCNQRELRTENGAMVECTWTYQQSYIKLKLNQIQGVTYAEISSMGD